MLQIKFFLNEQLSSMILLLNEFSMVMRGKKKSSLVSDLRA